ncbi:MAG: chemotaxis protein CheW [Opitutales bacterium]
MPPLEDDEILKEFILECREHLETIESDLLKIEENADGDVDELVNTVFRAAHSIKGGAGFMGLSAIQELAHKTENVLDRVRSKEIHPDPELINILLQSFDRLRDLLNDYANSEESDNTDLLKALTEILSGNLPAEEKASLQETVSVSSDDGSWRIDVNSYDLAQSARQGYFVYLVRLDLIHHIEARGCRPYDFIKEVTSAGTILASQFNLAAVGTLDDEPSKVVPLELLYSTIVGPEFVDGLFEGVPLENIHLLIDPQDPGKIMPPPNPEGEFNREPPTERAGPDAPRSPEAPEPERAAKSAAAPEDSPQEASSLATSGEGQVATRPESKPEKPQPENARVTRQERAGERSASTPVEETVRVSVSVLENLMGLAGELVLARNEMIEALRIKDEKLTESSASRINTVSSELQESIMQTRMQPVGNVFSKLPRLVRDIAASNGKKIQLETVGDDVEMDKTIIEGIGDPLTHMIRNSADHGIESPAEREAAGKPATGCVAVTARHQAGHVVIEIADDGKGMDPELIADSAVRKGKIAADVVARLSEKEKLQLIFLPGLSTAEQITDVSGRGVGMDVVKTNIDRLGGQVDIESEVGVGTRFRVSLPLTLAIMPTLLVGSGEELFAIPQTNIQELIRLEADEREKRIERISNRFAISIRDRLIPVVYLPALVRGEDIPLPEDRTLTLVIVESSKLTYGVFIDQLFDTEEIVVRPLGRHLRNCPEYAGATVLGNGRVAMILDVNGLAGLAGLESLEQTERAQELADTQASGRDTDEMQLLVFQNGANEPCAIPLHQIKRIERIEADQVENLGGIRAMQYLDGELPLVCLSDLAQVETIPDEAALIVLVLGGANGTEYGLLGSLPVDVTQQALRVDAHRAQRGISGTVRVNGKTTLLLNAAEIDPEALRARPALGGHSSSASDLPGAAIDDPGAEALGRVLIVEDSHFFRHQLETLLKAEGLDVTSAEDGQAAWEILEADPGAFDLLVTDLEMPRMGGLELTRQVRAHSQLGELPIIAVTTLADEEDIKRGLQAGVTEYQIKLDGDKLRTAIMNHLPLPAHE